MTLKFYIGRMTLEAGKSRLLGAYRFAFTISFYGKGYYRFRRKMKELRKKRKAMVMG